MMKKELLELLGLPTEKILAKCGVKDLKDYKKTLDKTMAEFRKYERELKKLMKEKVDQPRLEELAKKIFDAYPEAEFIAILERACMDDDSGNCRWYTRDAENPLPDIEEEDNDSSKWTKEIRDAYEELCEIFTRLYPDLNFDDEENAWWHRPDAYYGIDKDFDAARWGEED